MTQAVERANGSRETRADDAPRYPSRRGVIVLKRSTDPAGFSQAEEDDEHTDGVGDYHD